MNKIENTVIDKVLKWKVICVFLLGVASTLIFAKSTSFEYREPVANVVTKALNTSYQLSMGRNAMVTYSVKIASTLTLGGGQSGTVNLQTSLFTISFNSESLLSEKYLNTLFINWWQTTPTVAHGASTLPKS